MKLLCKNVFVRTWSVFLVLWTWTALANEAGSSTNSSLVGRAGAVQLLEFKKDQAVREVRVVKITPAGTNVAASTTITGDYGNEVKVGIVQWQRVSQPGKFLVTLAVSNHSTLLETDYLFSLDSRENPKEYYAPRTLELSGSVWTPVYAFKERFPPSELRVELLGGGR
ncbi:MAG TPA: hypothetical protein VNZ22_12360 [Bacillota bacterium]|nr:hypothetical protein [Bacillota bacterium]